VLGIVDHPNLVKLIGYCAVDGEREMHRFLVYEFMPNGSVDEHLASRSTSTLSWPMRLKVALDTARGLKYLHEEMNFEVIHLRSSNQLNVILLTFSKKGTHPIEKSHCIYYLSMHAGYFPRPENI
jgi:serine/threonine protein kinase